MYGAYSRKDDKERQSLGGGLLERLVPPVQMYEEPSRPVSLGDAFKDPDTVQMFKDVRQRISGNSESKSNTTGIPDNMKQDFEEKSGLSFDDVQVHYNSDKPAQLQALAYTQGNDVYVGPGQEQHLGHELGHVVQQKQGRVSANTSVNGMPVNDDERMEGEADNIFSNNLTNSAYQFKLASNHLATIQRVRPITNPLTQTGGNCGLYCIRMAINELVPGNTLTDNDYNTAAEQAGSNVGEIFSFPVMQTIITNLNTHLANARTVTQHAFTDAATLRTVINATGTNPALIAFSVVNIPSYATYGPFGAHAQEGHWSLIESFDQVTNELTMRDPNGGTFNIPLINMHQENANLASGQFDWSAYIAANPISPTNPNVDMPAMDTTLPPPQIPPNPYTLTPAPHTVARQGGQWHGAVLGAGGAPTIQIPTQQPLDLSGYIVEIS